MDISTKVVFQNALGVIFCHTVVQNDFQCFGVFQIGIGASGDHSTGAPDLHGKVRQENAVPADRDPDFRSIDGGREAGGFLRHAVQNLLAQALDAVDSAGIDREKHNSQHGGDQSHADGYKFSPQFLDHDKRSPLSKSLWKTWKTLKNQGFGGCVYSRQ